MCLGKIGLSLYGPLIGRQRLHETPQLHQDGTPAIVCLGGMRLYAERLLAGGQRRVQLAQALERTAPVDMHFHQAGIDAQAAYEAKMRDRAVLKRRVDGLRKSSMAEWAIMAETIGAQNLVQGVVARRAKVERFWGAYLPMLNTHLSRIDALPNVTDADRERRMVENLRGLRALKGKV